MVSKTFTADELLAMHPEYTRQKTSLFNQKNKQLSELEESWKQEKIKIHRMFLSFKNERNLEYDRIKKSAFANDNEYLLKMRNAIALEIKNKRDYYQSLVTKRYSEYEVYFGKIESNYEVQLKKLKMQLFDIEERNLDGLKAKLLAQYTLKHKELKRNVLDKLNIIKGREQVVEEKSQKITQWYKKIRDFKTKIEDSLRVEKAKLKQKQEELDNREKQLAHDRLYLQNERDGLEYKQLQIEKERQELEIAKIRLSDEIEKNKKQEFWKKYENNSKTLEDEIKKSREAREKRQQSLSPILNYDDALRVFNFSRYENLDADYIKQTYRDLAKEYHPDKHHTKELWVREEYTRKFKRLNDAYVILRSRFCF